MTAKIDILKKIDSSLAQLTKSQQGIARYLLDNPMEAAFSTVEQIANKANTSTATIIRFANSLGYQGFSQFQQELQEFLAVRANPLSRLETSFSLDENQGSSLAQIYRNQLKNLESTFNNIQESEFHRAVKLIGEAASIYTLGTRGSYCVTSYLAHHLNRVLQRANMLTDDGHLPEYILRIKPGDVLIITNMPRYSKQLYTTAQIARSMGAKTIIITDSGFSPYSQAADVLFLASCRSQDYHNSLLAALLIAEIIISLVIEKNLEQARLNLDRLEPIYSDLEIFFPVHKHPEGPET
jgi:DNA-binding MurR/RpiR family transcriptional regulator